MLVVDCGCVVFWLYVLLIVWWWDCIGGDWFGIIYWYGLGVVCYVGWYFLVWCDMLGCGGGVGCWGVDLDMDIFFVVFWVGIDI